MAANTKCIIIQPEGSYVVKKWPKSVAKQTDLLTSEVRGFFEAVRVDDYTMWVADAGAIRNDPVNPIASGMARLPLYGVAVVTGGTSPEGDTYGLTPEQHDKVIERFAHWQWKTLPF